MLFINFQSLQSSCISSTEDIIIYLTESKYYKKMMVELLKEVKGGALTGRDKVERFYLMYKIQFIQFYLVKG